MRVLVSKPNPSWPRDFLFESERIREALGPLALDVHHIGSTAIRGIFAKPIIDMLLVITDLQLLDRSLSAMAELGYQVMGEFGIPGRRYFRKNSGDGFPTHHVHAFEFGSSHVERHVAFRDYMNVHPVAAAAYSDLKQELANDHLGDLQAYIDGKNSFVKQHEAIALDWTRKARGAA